MINQIISFLLLIYMYDSIIPLALYQIFDKQLQNLIFIVYYERSADFCKFTVSLMIEFIQFFIQKTHKRDNISHFCVFFFFSYF